MGLNPGEPVPPPEALEAARADYVADQRGAGCDCPGLEEEAAVAFQAFPSGCSWIVVGFRHGDRCPARRSAHAHLN